ncbi:uncharacterized protein F5Z01DRAFT_331463 [Emericellopsis atlantica]|uniref:Uncharacterized protein n=1 Tax=Emericellopsis atlantica TaxID=2614577 RepID=A0A9P7ZFL4_9HYPO|nr:uncharacterized protein F5Z01DRAFT_331463 [Emericellopsis atlantica]KAG9251080.1 hypothetical protein F5Z01DRAFT_331463 [Emericellopsis atlantica]
MEWSKQTYNSQYEKWVPWMEDMYLYYFTKDNKASYSAKQNLDKSKVTGVDQVDKLQDGVNGVAAGQLGQGGLLQPVGDLASKEGANRAERQGKGNDGSYVPGQENLTNAASGVAEGGKNVAGTAASGLKGAGGYLGLGDGNKEEGEKKEQK